MKKSKNLILGILIIVLITIICILIAIKVGNKNIIQKQLEETQKLTATSEENSYITTEDHLAEVNASVAKLVEFKREIANAITDVGVATAENADATTMASNIRSLSVDSSKTDLLPRSYMLNTRTYSYDSYSITDEYIKLHINDTNTSLTYYNGIRSTSKIDFSKYTKLSIKYSYTSSNTAARFGVFAWTTAMSGSTGTTWNDNVSVMFQQNGNKNFLKVANSQEEEIVIDISDFNTVAYLYFDIVAGANANTGTTTLYIYDVKLFN